MLPHEKLYLEHLPEADRYYKSFMHRDTVNFVTVTKWVWSDVQVRAADVDADRNDFVLTTSVDGHLKFWKKQEVGIEFVKHYRTSLKAIVAVAASEDGAMFATVSENGESRVFDVEGFGELQPWLCRNTRTLI